MGVGPRSHARCGALGESTHTLLGCNVYLFPRCPSSTPRTVSLCSSKFQTGSVCCRTESRPFEAPYTPACGLRAQAGLPSAVSDPPRRARPAPTLQTCSLAASAGRPRPEEQERERNGGRGPQLEPLPQTGEAPPNCQRSGGGRCPTGFIRDQNLGV